jgi:hypothetical protein
VNATAAQIANRPSHLVTADISVGMTQAAETNVWRKTDFTGASPGSQR